MQTTWLDVSESN